MDARTIAAKVHYLVRYLPPNSLGTGVICAAFSSSSEVGIKELRKAHPGWFSEPGFYTIMRATGETLTVCAALETDHE